MSKRNVAKEQSLLRRMVDKRKSLESILEESKKDQEAEGAKLRLFDLLMIGIGATIGSGVFVLTGKALAYAGPAAVVAWICAGLICLLSSSSYMELSARLPTKGSCYVFSYHGMGEFVGVIGAACLTMEYGISGSGIARSWAAKVYIAFGHWWVWCYNGDQAPTEACNDNSDYYFDPLAGVITVLCTVVIILGMDMGKIVINGFTICKICLVLFMIIAGFSMWQTNIFASPQTFFPNPGGVIQATSTLFFGFIGFDEVCCMSSKAENPSSTMPKALVGTLLGAACMSGIAQLALAAMVPYEPGMEATAFEEAFKDLGLHWAQWIVSIGEAILLPLVVLLSILPQPELTAAMSEDGLLPSLFRRQSRFNGMYIRGSAVVGILLTIVSMFVPFDLLWNMISVGVLFSFNLTNASIINIRYGNGGEVRNRCVNILVWVIMICCCVAGYACNLGVVEPFFDNKPVAAGYIATTAFYGLAAFVVAAIIQIKFPVTCDMSDPSIFKAPGVPYVQTLAMLFNFFLISTLGLNNVISFAVFLVFIVAVYIIYICKKGDQASLAENVEEEGTSEESEGSEDDEGASAAE